MFNQQMHVKKLFFLNIVLKGIIVTLYKYLQIWRSLAYSSFYYISYFKCMIFFYLVTLFKNTSFFLFSPCQTYRKNFLKSVNGRILDSQPFTAKNTFKQGIGMLINFLHCFGNNVCFGIDSMLFSLKCIVISSGHHICQIP